MKRLLLSSAAMAFTAATAAQDIASLERSLEKARQDAPMVLKPFVVVSRPAKYFGDYDVRPSTTFGRGEKMYFYIEPKNLVNPPNSKGQYEPAFEVDLEVNSKAGESLKKPAFATFRLPGKSRVQDIFLNLTLSLDQAPAGPYTVRFLVRDLNSNKVGSVEQVIAIR
jgi:hypothetical protein